MHMAMCMMFIPENMSLPDELEETDYVVFLDGIQGDGTVNSAIRDLYLFDQALYTEEIIGKESKDQAFTPGYWNEEEQFGYGFGWMIQNSPQKGKVISHDGGWPGYSTLMIRYIDQNKTLIYLSNMEQSYQFEQAVIAAAVNILFDQPYVIPKRPADQKKQISILRFTADLPAITHFRMTHMHRWR